MGFAVQDSSTEQVPCNKEFLVFGGTVEARLLCEWLSSRNTCKVTVCCVTEYGGELVEGLANVEVLVGSLDDAQKEHLIAGHAFDCIIDATHPYATHVTQSIEKLAQAHGIPHVRLLRKENEAQDCTLAHSMEDAASILKRRSGNILLTTGSKDLETFTSSIPDFEQRLYARVLPLESSIKNATDLGISTGNIIAMKGPFSTELNCALIHEYDIKVLVTKASGSAGGFEEKLEAAKRCACELVVVSRPVDETGLDLEETKRHLESEYGA